MPIIVFRRLQRGFTLVELAVTLTVAGILAAIAAPSFQTFLRSNRLTTASNDLLADLNFARTEAVKRQGGTVAGQSGQMVVCVSSNGTDCTGAPDTWNSGWIVFWDQDRSGTFSVAANDVLLKTHGAFPSGLTVTSGATAITYDATGAVQPITGVTVTVTDSEIGKSRKVNVTGTGQGSVS